MLGQKVYYTFFVAILPGKHFRGLRRLLLLLLLFCTSLAAQASPEELTHCFPAEFQTLPTATPQFEGQGEHLTAAMDLSLKAFRRNGSCRSHRVSMARLPPACALANLTEQNERERWNKLH